jgi:hypothetical protein
MEFLSFLAFVAAWGLMWRWVVKNRGSWNLFYGNIVGAAGGFIVGMVVLSIFLSLFPSAHKPKRAPTEEVITQNEVTTSLLPEAESDSTPVALENAPGFAAIEPDNQPSPPDSALLPNYANRAPKSMSEKPFWIRATRRAAKRSARCATSLLSMPTATNRCSRMSCAALT